MALSTDLFSSLRKDILQGKLRQGEKLTEQQICDEYNVSRTPVREAFRQLELEGFIESYRHDKKELNIILTGGDSIFFDTLLKNSIFAPYIKIEPQLVLKGLNAAIQKHND